MSAPVSNQKFIAVSLPLLALGSAKTQGVCSPVTGTIVHMGVGVNTAVDGDNIVHGEVNGTPVTGLSLTLTTSEVAGKTKQAFPTLTSGQYPANARVKRGDFIGVETDGGGTVGDVVVTFLIEQD